MKRIITLLLCICMLAGCGTVSSSQTNNSGLKYKTKTKNFIIYYSKSDKKSVKDIAKVLDDSYYRITSQLECKPNKIFTVKIYPNLQDFHNGIGEPNAESWVVGTCIGDEIDMVSPLNPSRTLSYNDILQVAPHEFTHIITRNINPKALNIQWLCEGIATYEAKQMPEEVKKAIAEYVEQNKVPSLDKLETYQFQQLGGYAFSYTIIEYIVKTYGYEPLIAFIKRPDDYKNAFGISKEEFEIGWMYFLKENYK